MFCLLTHSGTKTTFLDEKTTKIKQDRLRDLLNPYCGMIENEGGRIIEAKLYIKIYKLEIFGVKM